jgi:hypothetical protein
MASANTSQIGPSNRDFLAALGEVYRGRRVQRDAFGRRMALPSEIARALAKARTDADPPADRSCMPGSEHIAFRQSALEIEES